MSRRDTLPATSINFWKIMKYRLGQIIASFGLIFVVFLIFEVIEKKRAKQYDVTWSRELYRVGRFFVFNFNC